MIEILNIIICVLLGVGITCFMFGITGHIIETSQKLDKIIKHLGIDHPQKE